MEENLTTTEIKFARPKGPHIRSLPQPLQSKIRFNKI